MRLTTLFATLGLILSALAALYFWQIMQVAGAVAGSTGPDTNRASWIATGVFFLGLAIFLICVVISVVAKNGDA